MDSGGGVDDDGSHAVVDDGNHWDGGCCQWWFNLFSECFLMVVRRVSFSWFALGETECRIRSLVVTWV